MKRLCLTLAALAALAVAPSVPFAAADAEVPRGSVLSKNAALPKSARPAPGGRHAYLRVTRTRPGAQLLAYRNRSGSRARICFALAPTGSRDVGPVRCSRVGAFLAPVRSEGIRLENGASGKAGRPTPFYGLVRGAATKVTVKREGSSAVRARLSEPFTLAVPASGDRPRREMEVRAFLTSLGPLPPDGPSSVDVVARFTAPPGS